MKRILLALLAALAIGLPAHADFSFRTTGEQSMRVFTVRPTPSSSGVPSLSNANHVKFWVPDTGHGGYSAGNIYISQNGGAWTLLSSFVGTGPIVSVFGRTGTITAQSGDYTATLITSTATGSIAATTVQTALAELATEKVDASRTITAGTGLSGGGDLSANRTLSVSFTNSSGLAGLLSDETGTGAFVLASSPTLTTPNLGTPSAATLTNATGLPIATGVSGLATGIATFLGTSTSANLATAVTNETGSGALVFGTSPTLSGPIFSTIVNTGTLTLPTSTDTLVGRATTDTLTNKSISLGSNTVTATSAQLATAISDETGTGNVVFSTGASLTAPLTVTGGSFNTGIVQTSSNTIGTGFTLANTDTGGRSWSMISTGSGASPTAGKLGFYDGTTAYRLVLSTSGVQIGQSGTPIGTHASGTASLDYATAGANTCATATITVTGATEGSTNTVQIGVPNALAAHNTTSTFFAWVSASNTVTVRRCVITADGSDPAAATVRASANLY